MNIMNQVVILSAELSNLSEAENRVRTSTLYSLLGELFQGRAKSSIGHYKGSQEMSAVIIVKNNEELETLKKFAFKNFKQESILHQDSNGAVHLVYGNGNEELLGRLHRVNVDYIECNSVENYTTMNGDYFVTKSWVA